MMQLLPSEQLEAYNEKGESLSLPTTISGYPIGALRDARTLQIWFVAALLIITTLVMVSGNLGYLLCMIVVLIVLNSRYPGHELALWNEASRLAENKVVGKFIKITELEFNSWAHTCKLPNGQIATFTGTGYVGGILSLQLPPGQYLQVRRATYGMTGGHLCIHAADILEITK